MEPQEVRELLIKPGTRISLSGEYGGESTWSPSVITGVLKAYIVVEHIRATWVVGHTVWDTAVIVALDSVLYTQDFYDTDYVGSEVLLLHRYEDVAWDNDDPTVLVFGIKQAEILGEGPLAVAMWRPKTMPLAGAAVMAVHDPLAPSQLALLHKARGRITD